jgi:hypothetical protein
MNANNAGPDSADREATWTAMKGIASLFFKRKSRSKKGRKERIQ